MGVSVGLRLTEQCVRRYAPLKAEMAERFPAGDKPEVGQNGKKQGEGSRMDSLLPAVDWDAKFLGLSILELVAAVLGLISVGLTVRQNVWCWPTGAVMVALYAFIFWRTKLYADAGLQVIYFVLQFYGWYEWLRGGEGQTALPVSRTSPRLLLGLGILGVCGTAAMGTALGHWTDQAFPYGDSAVTVFSLIAQWMMARKLLENWLFWIGVDVLAVGIYWAKELYPTAVLYTVFLAMCVAGYRLWRRSLLTAPAQA
jgi:nicotinamide mononucleotide transporter